MAPRLSHILFVEDDPDIRAVASLALEALGGFALTVCRDGSEALDAVRRAAPDLVLMDVLMPVLDGPATLAALRADSATAGLPVIMMTAIDAPHEARALRDMGALDVIVKPFDPMTLAQTVAQIWNTRHDANT